MNDKVYVIVFNSYEPGPDDGGCYSQVEGIFSTKEKAEEYCKRQISKLLKEYHDDNNIDWHYKEGVDNCITDDYTELGYYFDEYELDKVED